MASGTKRSGIRIIFITTLLGDDFPITKQRRTSLNNLVHSQSFGDRLNNSDLHYAGLSNKRAATKIVTKGNKTICLMSQASKTCRPKYFQWSRSTKLI